MSSLSSSYLENIDSELKAYILGLIVFNVYKIKKDEIIIQIDDSSDLRSDIRAELDKLALDCERDSFCIKSDKIISDICKHLGIENIAEYYKLNIKFFVDNNKKEYVIEFLKAFYEKHGNINHYADNTYICNITASNKDNVIIFADFFGIPYKQSNIFNLFQISYTNVNIIDLLGIIYKHTIYTRVKTYKQFLEVINGIRPILKYAKITNNAITPTKTNFSDAGFDISIIALYKVLDANTSLYHTGIKLDIPTGYYIEMIPRSSISKSGYMLANSIGIIDCSYKGELLVALTKINAASAKLDFPYRCCQLIMRQQIFPEMIEIKESDISDTNRAEGGFGSTNTI